MYIQYEWDLGCSAFRTKIISGSYTSTAAENYRFYCYTNTAYEYLIALCGISLNWNYSVAKHKISLNSRCEVRQRSPLMQNEVIFSKYHFFESYLVITIRLAFVWAVQVEWFSKKNGWRTMCVCKKLIKIISRKIIHLGNLKRRLINIIVNLFLR